MTALLPQKLYLYSALLRLNKPTGIFLLLWPCWWGALAAPTASIPYKALLWLTMGAILMRGAGCIINDMWDRRLDTKVKRTQHRPLASGALHMPEALILLAIVLMAALCVAVQLPSAALITAIAVLPLVVLYPLAKRYTRYPQLVLALTFNWGVWVGWYAAYDNLSLTTIFLYLAAVCWTMAYDTIYAYQDKADDEKIGVKSTAVTFGARGAVWVGRFYTGMAIFLFLALMALNATLYHYAAIGFSIGLFLSLTYHRPFMHQPDVATALFHLNAVLGGIVALTLLF